MLNVSDDATLPGFEELENPQSNLASRVFSQLTVVEIREVLQRESGPTLNTMTFRTGWWKRLWQQRTRDTITTPVLMLRALGRVAIYGHGYLVHDGRGGAKHHLSQQLAKLLFPRK